MTHRKELHVSGFTDEAKQRMLDDLEELNDTIREALENGTFLSVIFNVMVQESPEQAGIYGYRHGFHEASKVLLDDMVKRYTENDREVEQGTGHTQ